MAAIEILVNNLKLEEKTSAVPNVKSTDVLESVNVTVDLKSHTLLSQEGHMHLCVLVSLKFGLKKLYPILMVFIDPAVSDTFMPEDSRDKLFEAWWLNMAWHHNGERYTCYDLAFQLFVWFFSPAMSR